MARKTISKSYIIKEVKIILDENDDSAPLVGVGDINQLKTDEIIEHLIATAIDRVVAMASLSKVVGMAVDAPSIDWDDSSDPYCMTCILPSNLSRLVYVRLSSWKRGVSNIINDTDDKYLEYRSDFEGIRPDALDPGVAIRPYFGTQIVIECYPKGSKANAIVKYIPLSEEVDLDENGNEITGGDGEGGTGSDGTPNTEKGYVISQEVERAILYMIANLYYVTLGEADRAELMAAQVKDILGLYNQQNVEQ